MRRASSLVALATSASLFAGCTHHVTYAYQYQIKEDMFGGDEQPEQPPVEARQLLAGAKTVAFFPPDSCLNTDTSENRKRMQELRASCGVLMSKLERAAQGAGYEVLSWQNLRGGKRPIDYAREANVDVLFEINEFEPNELPSSQIERKLSFFERSEAGQDSPLVVSDDLARTCRQSEPEALRNEIVALTGSIDIKTVSVADGRDRWHYRKTEARSLGRQYQPQFYSAIKQPHWSTVPLGVIGGLGLIGGGVIILVENLSSDDPATPENEKVDAGSWGTNLLIVGAIGIAAAIAAGVVFEGHKPAPEEVLCNSLMYVPPPPTPTQSPTYSSEHTFEETHIADVVTQRKREIQDSMVKEFIDVLKDVKAGQPSPSPAPVQPAPAPPAPTPAQP
jgi:hypothetical protein